MIDRQGHVHFVAIGGSGMSALAHLLLARGHRVSGCDIRESPATSRLRALGATVHMGHDAAHLGDAELVVVSRAVPDETAEVEAARARGLRVWHRAQMLGEVMRAERAVAIVGTHGKTTTSGMTALVLAEGGLDPTALVGADVVDFDGNTRVGRTEWVVAEVDESDGSLVHVTPWAAVLTSLDLTDHADFYASGTHLERTFRVFLQGLRPGGFAVLCADHPRVMQIRHALRRPVVTYALDAPADFRAEVRAQEGLHTKAIVRQGARRLGELALHVPGRYNIANALAATTVGLHAGVSFEAAARALAAFRGIARRFEVRADVDGVLVVDDYAHNPVKVAAALRGARESFPERRIVALFQPHRYTRTQTTHQRFAGAFDDADDVYVTDIYPADEPPIPGVTAQLIVDGVAARRTVRYIPAMDEAAAEVARRARAGDLILTLGAGDIWTAADEIVRRLRARVAS